MKKLILVGALALLAACGDTKVQTASSNTSNGGVTTPKTDDTVTVKDVGDMPPKCIELFSDFLKKIEPEVSKIDWSKATAAQMSTLDESFQKESDDMDAQMTAAGCDKYNLDATDEQTFEQLTKIAAAEAPGTVGFLTFIKSLSEAASTPAAGSVSGSCAEIIAQIEALIADGTPLQDRPIAEATQIGQLVGAVSTQCTPEEAQAFLSREDVAAVFEG